MKKIFIIGGGIAALEAAKSARSTQRDALIVLISAENFLPYSRPMLTKQLMGKVTAQDLAVESAAWYDEKDIVVLTGRTVAAIDPVGKTLVAGGTPFHWDSLILATGASCFVPPIPGADGANVVAVRTFGDVARVREIAKTAKNAAVIGGGVLGLEAASSLAKAGLSVTVLEHGDQLMKRQIDAQAAQHLESAMAGKGVKLLKTRIPRALTHPASPSWTARAFRGSWSSYQRACGQISASPRTRALRSSATSPSMTICARTSRTCTRRATARRWA